MINYKTIHLNNRSPVRTDDILGLVRLSTRTDYNCLEIDNCNFSHDPEVLKDLAELISTYTIKSFILHRCTIPADLLTLIPSSSITKIKFSKIALAQPKEDLASFMEKFVNLLKTSQHLTKISLQSLEFLGDLERQIILETLLPIHLKELEYTSNTVSTQDLKHISNILEKNTLTTLTLSKWLTPQAKLPDYFFDNNRSGISQFYQSLAKNTSLKTLSISLKDFECTSFKTFLEKLLENNALETLIIEGKCKEGYGQALGDFLNHSKIKKLILDLEPTLELINTLDSPALQSLWILNLAISEELMANLFIKFKQLTYLQISSILDNFFLRMPLNTFPQLEKFTVFVEYNDLEDTHIIDNSIIKKIISLIKESSIKELSIELPEKIIVNNELEMELLQALEFNTLFRSLTINSSPELIQKIENITGTLEDRSNSRFKSQKPIYPEGFLSGKKRYPENNDDNNNNKRACYHA